LNVACAFAGTETFQVADPLDILRCGKFSLVIVHVPGIGSTTAYGAIRLH